MDPYDVTGTASHCNGFSLHAAQHYLLCKHTFCDCSYAVMLRGFTPTFSHPVCTHHAPQLPYSFHLAPAAGLHTKKCHTMDAYNMAEFYM